MIGSVTSRRALPLLAFPRYSGKVRGLPKVTENRCGHGQVAPIGWMRSVAGDGDRMQPVGAKWPRPHRFSITFGEPLSFPEYRGKAGNGKARREVTDRIMEAIAELSGQEKAGW